MPSYESVPSAAGGNYFINVPGAGANTKGAWVQITASTSIDSSSHLVMPGNQSTVQRTFADIGTGAAASEVVLIPDFLVQTGNQQFTPGTFNCQFFADIPTATRIAIRIQQDVPFVGCSFSMMLRGDSTEGLASPTNYGANLGNTQGVLIDPGAIINTKGAYSQLTASSAAAHEYVTVMLGLRGNIAPTNGGTWANDLAIGPAASEVVIVPDYRLVSVSTAQQLMQASQMWVVDEIPAATRIAYRAQSIVIDATDRVFECVIVCGEIPAGALTAGGSVAVF